MKKFLVVLLSLLLVLLVGILTVDEKLPSGNQGAEADELTDLMFNALNKTAWDTLPFISWSFRNSHHYVWDKVNKLGSIRYDNVHVLLNVDKVQGRVFKEGKEIFHEEAQDHINKAWSYWCNDSFWLMAPFKARDPGTSRSYIELENGKRGLLVQYESGGVTPGDAYLWVLNEQGIPESYKMWVSIIPIGGVEATWASWKEFDNVLLSTEHKLGPLDIPVTDIKTGFRLQDIEQDDFLFNPLFN